MTNVTNVTNLKNPPGLLPQRTDQTNRNYIRHFACVPGRYNTLAPFIVMSGNQESLSGSGTISLDCYHTKLFSTDSPVTVSLESGLQDGQLKKLQYVHKGKEMNSLTVECPAILGDNGESKIWFSNVGDYVLLAWTGQCWCVLESGNTTDPRLDSPKVL